MTGIRKKNKILGFIFAVLAVWMVIFQNPSYAAQRCSLNVKTEQAGMTVYLYRVAEKQAGVYVLNENFQASGADVSGGGSREAAITLTNFVKAQGPSLPDRNGKRKTCVFSESSGWRGSLPCDGGSADRWRQDLHSGTGSRGSGRCRGGSRYQV